MPQMRKTVSVTTKLSLALKRRLQKDADRNGMSVSAFLEDQIACSYYGRGRTADNLKTKNVVTQTQDQ